MKYIWHFAKSMHAFSGKILYLNLIGITLISLVESMGIILLVPLVSVTGVLNVKSANFSAISWIQGLFENIPKEIRLVSILSLYVFIIIAQGYFQRKQSILSARLQHGYLRYLREETYRNLVRAKWRFFLNKRKSDIINMILSEIGRVSSGTQMILQFITSLVFTLVQIGFAFWLSPKLTLAILSVGILLIILSRKIVNKSRKIGEETSELGKVYLAGITDHFNGIKDIKSNTLEESHIAWVHDLGVRLENNVVKAVKLNTVSQFIFKVVSAFLMVGLVYLSVLMFQAQQAEVMLIIAIFSRLWPRISGIQSTLEQIGAIIPSCRNLIEMQNECLVAQEIYEDSYLNLKPIHINKGIECRDVFFRYNFNQPTFALQHINAYIPSKKMTAIVGRSGAGKSTLIDLLMGLNQPEKGQVLIDEIPLTSENLLSLRRSVSYVAQDPFLFNTTIRDNLLIMEPNASEDQIWEALEFSSAAEFIKKLPRGLDTLIGDRGIRLSGGERQRIVLARAILRNPSILVLDEATSALDTVNEFKIQKSLERLKGKMTIIVIAHRLSTIRNADQVIVLEKGEVIQNGEYVQLANDNQGVFSELLKRQLEVSG